MVVALLYGAAASSALVIGAVAGAYSTPPRKLVATALAFASGSLISALAFDLIKDAFEAGGTSYSGLGFRADAATFIVIDALLG